ncbi:MAG TPA: CxxC-x17-CxxC domain-containing protein [Planctomycetota bacterium]|nr:CxxC-x17-CxxC domain-containing protein [Planctomycetota bacterium]
MSTFTDKQLKCIECNGDFTYTVAEQELHQSLGYQNEPKRCTPCREAKRQRKGGGGAGGGGGPRGGGGGGPRGGGPREFFTAICGECGKEAQLPFKPRGDRPVYCSDCFSKKRTPM